MGATFPSAAGRSSSCVYPYAAPTHAVSPVRALGLALLLAAPVTLANKLDTSRPYPFDPEGLPAGTVKFLDDRNATGNLIMNPSLAGYAQWVLSPKVRVFSDMELPPSRTGTFSASLAQPGTLTPFNVSLANIRSTLF